MPGRFPFRSSSPRNPHIEPVSLGEPPSPEDERLRKREALVEREERLQTERKPEPDNSARPQFILGLCLGLLPWGLSLIGITINLAFGCIILAFTFALIAHAFWIWERARRWPIWLRVVTITLAFVFSAGFVLRQVLAQYRQQIAPITSASPSPTQTPTPIAIASPSPLSIPTPVRVLSSKPKQRTTKRTTKPCTWEDTLLGRC